MSTELLKDWDKNAIKSFDLETTALFVQLQEVDLRFEEDQSYICLCW
jgi:hypothetical protein